MTAPYVPTLGPIQPGALSAELFNAIVDVAHTGRFLPYDKDRRWSASKDERVITDEITHRPGLTVIPTISTRGRGTVKIHHYGDEPPDHGEATEQARKLGAAYGVGGARLIWCQDTPDGARTRLMLKMFGDQDLRHQEGVVELSGCAVADTFPAFAEQLGVDGFAFLYQRMQAGIDDGPVLVTVEDRRIVGAVGPLSTLTDASGARTQPPQYFAVHPDYRQRGHGRALWRAAMAWGRQNGARYKVLQAAAGSAAERLYMSEGMSTLGFVCVQDLAA